MTTDEQIFFKRLVEYVKDKDYLVCPKVRLSDIVDIEKKRWHRRWDFIGRPWTVSGKLDRSHIDFVLIGKSDPLIKFGIELDDPSHNTSQAQLHDRVKTEAFESVGLKLLRFSDSHTTEEEFKQKGIL